MNEHISLFIINIPISCLIVMRFWPETGSRPRNQRRKQMGEVVVGEERCVWGGWGEVGGGRCGVGVGGGVNGRERKKERKKKKVHGFQGVGEMVGRGGEVEGKGGEGGPSHQWLTRCWCWWW